VKKKPDRIVTIRSGFVFLAAIRARITRADDEDRLFEVDNVRKW
jgi:hypothetical protein